MAPRASWKGYLKLSLVSCPINLYPVTTETNKVKFKTLNKATGNPLKQRMVDSVTDNEVESENRIKGYEIGKNEYLPVDPSEIEALKIESSKTIEIDSFVSRDQVDDRFCDSPYYLVPDGKVGQEAFAVIREAMKSKNVVGIGRVVLSSRERPIMLEPFGKGVRATTLRFSYEVRAEGAYFEDIPDRPVAAELLQLAETIVDGKLGDFDPTAFVDRYEDALIQMLEDKKAGRPVKIAEPKEPSNVVNLMDALRAAAAQTGSKAKPAKAEAKAAPAKSKVKPKKAA